MATNYKKPNLWTDEEINLKIEQQKYVHKRYGRFFDNKTLKA